MKISFIILLFFITTLVANQAPQMSIDAEIAKIKSAPSSERVRLMNDFKMRVSQMNTQERSATIKKMQVKMHAKNATMPLREHMSQMQVHDSRDMKNFQNMNQKQVGNMMQERPTFTKPTMDNRPNTEMNKNRPNMEQMRK